MHICAPTPVPSASDRVCSTPRRLDPEFHPGAGPNAAVECLSIQDDGRILLAGPFTSINGQPKSGLARLHADGTLDRAFTVTLKGRLRNAQATSLAVQADGRILVAGAFTRVNGARRGRLARLFPDGSLDRTFLEDLPGATGWVRDVRPQADGTILVGGRLTRMNGHPCLGIARLGNDGALDPQFVPSSTGLKQAEAKAIAVQRDGRILIGGRFISQYGTVLHLLRLRADGSPDTTFLERSMGPNADVGLIQVQQDGRIVIGGLFTSLDGVARTKLARLHPDGKLDATFTSPLGPQDILCCLAPLRSNALIVGGRFHFSGNEQANAIALLNADGTVESSFSTMFMPTSYRFWVFALALQPDGRLIVGGSFREVNGVRRRNIARLLLQV